MNEKSKFHQQLHHKHELEHLYNIYVEIKHYNSLTYLLHWQKNNYTHILQTNPNNLMVRICHQSLSSNHFSTQLSFYWGTSLVQTDLNKLKVKCCRLEIAVYMRVSYQLLKCNYSSAHSLFVYNFNVPLIVDSFIIISFAKEFIQWFSTCWVWRVWISV